MTQYKKKITSIQKDLMIGITSSLMFYVISEIANTVDKLEDFIHRLILLFMKGAIATRLRWMAMKNIRNKFYD